MFKSWYGSAGEMEILARQLEAHLNEFAEEVISVSYAVSGSHYVLAVYRELDVSSEQEQAVSVAEQIIDDAHP